MTTKLANYLLTIPLVTATFTITILDPCLTTSITNTPSTVDNLVSFAGYPTQSQNTYTFNDLASLSINAMPDFCGDKILDLKLNGTATSLLTGNNQDFIYFSPPADTTDFGVGQATV